jgi:hypothetical protein
VFSGTISFGISFLRLSTRMVVVTLSLVIFHYHHLAELSSWPGVVLVHHSLITAFFFFLSFFLWREQETHGCLLRSIPCRNC